MTNRKVSKAEELVEEVEEQPIFKDGDYYTALVKVPGKRELVKIRGIISSDDYLCEDVYLLNNQGVGDEIDCDSVDEDGFFNGVRLNGYTQSALDEGGVKKFTILTDKRQKAVIDADKRPDILGHRVIKTSKNRYSFGCGAVQVTKEEIEIFLKYMTELNASKEGKKFLDLIRQITSEESGDALDEIDLDDVRKLIAENTIFD